MLIPVPVLKKYLFVRPSGILHVGAHEGEEARDYEKHWGAKTIWVEAQEKLASDLASRLDPLKNKVLSGAIWSEDGLSLDLHITNNGQSSSLLNLEKHLEFYPQIRKISNARVKTKRIDSIIRNELGFDFMNLDIQGAELEALKGAGDRLSEFKYIYCEVNRIHLYKDCALVGQIDEYLKHRGFLRVVTLWTKKGWGDALYVAKSRPWEFSLALFGSFFVRLRGEKEVLFFPKKRIFRIFRRIRRALAMDRQTLAKFSDPAE